MLIKFVKSFGLVCLSTSLQWSTHFYVVVIFWPWIIFTKNKTCNPRHTFLQTNHLLLKWNYNTNTFTYQQSHKHSYTQHFLAKSIKVFGLVVLSTSLRWSRLVFLLSVVIWFWPLFWLFLNQKYWKIYQDLLKCLEKVHFRVNSKTSWRRHEDVLATLGTHPSVMKTSWRRLEDVLETSWIHYLGICCVKSRFWMCFHLKKL